MSRESLDAWWLAVRIVAVFVLQIMTAIDSTGLMPNFMSSSLQTLTDRTAKWSLRLTITWFIHSLLPSLRCAVLFLLGNVIKQTRLLVA